MLAIEVWGSSSHVRNAMEKIKEDNRKVRKIVQTVNQTFTFGPKHDKIRA
jgi:hypothetical protein